ncbi:MAG: DCC1-like thiol-disulfide oxidoreductase family protein [Phormidesmis sp.]
MYTVIYDGNCNLCVTLVQLLEKLDRAERFDYVPMQNEERLDEFGVSAADCEMGMILIAPSSSGDSAADPAADSAAASARRWQGSDAAEEIGRLLPMGAVFVNAYRALPGAKPAGDRAYSFIRDNRYSLFGKRDETYISDAALCDDDSCKRAL